MSGWNNIFVDNCWRKLQTKCIAEFSGDQQLVHKSQARTKKVVAIRKLPL